MVSSKQAIREAQEKHAGLTPSVVVLARLMKVTPNALAVAFSDTEANAVFNEKLAGEMVVVGSAQARKEREAENA